MRIGQILSRSIPLSDHDVEEILHEQHASRGRFGDAAMALGKARPQQVWDAWLTQLRDGPVDLDGQPTDAMAVLAVPGDLAKKHRAVPLRLRGIELVIALAGDASADVLAEFSRVTGLRVIAATASADAIDRTLAKYYPAVEVPAA